MVKLIRHVSVKEIGGDESGEVRVKSKFASVTVVINFIHMINPSNLLSSLQICLLRSDPSFFLLINIVSIYTRTLLIWL